MADQDQASGSMMKMRYTEQDMHLDEIIAYYYEPDSEAHSHLIRHGRAVAAKALRIAHRVAHLRPDLAFIEEAALLHDIGMIRTHAPLLGCFGTLPYIAHGYIGRSMLEELAFPRHALVCERHVGTGLTIAQIREGRLPLPLRDMSPQSIEEQIICFADKFFSKNDHDTEIPLAAVREQVGSYGDAQLSRFDAWAVFFQEIG